MRNRWLCSDIEDWTKTSFEEANTELHKLALHVPGALETLALPQANIPARRFYRNVQKYKRSIRNSQHEKIQLKIKKLRGHKGSEVYVERKFKGTTNGKTTSEVRDLMMPNRVVLLKGEAGSGKSSVATKLVQRWSEGEDHNDIVCILFLSAGSLGKVSLQRILWDGHSDSVNWTEDDFKEAYLCLKDLAIEGKIAIVIDGLDELGSFTTQDVSHASQAATNPHLDVDLRTACAGILAQKILPGARVIATGRTTNLLNQQLLRGTASLFDLEPMSRADRDAMVEKLELNVSERGRI